MHAWVLNHSKIRFICQHQGSILLSALHVHIQDSIWAARAPAHALEMSSMEQKHCTSRITEKMVAPLWFYLHPSRKDSLVLLDTYRPTCDLYKATTCCAGEMPFWKLTTEKTNTWMFASVNSCQIDIANMLITREQGVHYYSSTILSWFRILALNICYLLWKIKQ